MQRALEPPSLQHTLYLVLEEWSDEYECLIQTAIRLPTLIDECFRVEHAFRKILSRISSQVMTLRHELITHAQMYQRATELDPCERISVFGPADFNLTPSVILELDGMSNDEIIDYVSQLDNIHL